MLFIYIVRTYRPMRMQVNAVYLIFLNLSANEIAGTCFFSLNKLPSYENVRKGCLLFDLKLPANENARKCIF